MLESSLPRFLKLENIFIIFVIFTYIRVTNCNEDSSEISMQYTCRKDIFDKYFRQCTSKTVALQLALDVCRNDDIENDTIEHSNLQTGIACASFTLDIKCNGNQVLNIVSANYGRKEPGYKVCPHNKIQSANCFSNNAKSIVMGLCQNKSSCRIWASNSIFNDPCVHTYKYMEVVYECQ